MSEITVYKLTKEMQDLKNLVYNDEIDDQTFIDTFESMQIMVEDKVEACGYIIAMLDSDIEKAKKEKQHYDTIRSILVNRQKKLQESIKKMMLVAEINEIHKDDGRFTAKIQNAGGPLALEYDEQNVPMDYMKIIMQPDEEKIRAALDKGEKLDFARYKERQKILVLK